MTENLSARPRHIAIIMDGNGRWAVAQGRNRAAGHREGVKTLRRVVEQCVRAEIPVLSVFAFSSENWRRPAPEVSLLMDLFMKSLDEEVEALHRNGVNLSFIGDRAAFPASLQDAVQRAEKRTAANPGLKLRVAANYGGRWEIANACRNIGEMIESGDIRSAQVDEALLAAHLSMSDVPEPDLFIRTGGERRISNFLLWELAYTELYFTDVLWPEFKAADLDDALAWFASRQRRFGRTSEQLEGTDDCQ